MKDSEESKEEGTGGFWGPRVAEMTLRDYFAGQVLMGLDMDHEDLSEYAGNIYKIADAMIRARHENP
jgi:hypothetical protein